MAVRVASCGKKGRRGKTVSRAGFVPSLRQGLLRIGWKIAWVAGPALFKRSVRVEFGGDRRLIRWQAEFADEKMSGCFDLLFRFQPVFFIMPLGASILFPIQIGQPGDLVMFDGRYFDQGHFSHARKDRLILQVCLSFIDSPPERRPDFRQVQLPGGSRSRGFSLKRANRFPALSEIGRRLIHKAQSDRASSSAAFECRRGHRCRKTTLHSNRINHRDFSEIVPTHNSRIVFSTMGLSGGLAVNPFYGVAKKLGRAVEIQFFFDVGAVSLDGTDAQMQFGGNLACAASLAKQAVNFQFAVR